MRTLRGQPDGPTNPARESLPTLRVQVGSHRSVRGWMRPLTQEHPMQATKTCTKCHTTKPATTEFFPLRRESRDGFRSWCRTCKRASNARWQAAHPNPEVARANTVRWRAANPEGVKAQIAANSAVRAGRLARPGACERCGRPSTRLDKHHEDYSRPLDVTFLCASCHKRIHLRRPVDAY
jgi:hypothetical protein